MIRERSSVTFQPNRLEPGRSIEAPDRLPDMAPVITTERNASIDGLRGAGASDWRLSRRNWSCNEHRPTLKEGPIGFNLVTSRLPRGGCALS